MLLQLLQNSNKQVIYLLGRILTGLGPTFPRLKIFYQYCRTNYYCFY